MRAEDLFNTMFAFVLPPIDDHRAMDQSGEFEACGYAEDPYETLHHHAVWFFRSRTGHPSFWYYRHDEDNHATWWEFVRGRYGVTIVKNEPAVALTSSARYQWQAGGGMGYDVSRYARTREVPELEGTHVLRIAPGFGGAPCWAFEPTLGRFAQGQDSIFGNDDTLWLMRERREYVRDWDKHVLALAARMRDEKMPMDEIASRVGVSAQDLRVRLRSPRA